MAVADAPCATCVQDRGLAQRSRSVNSLAKMRRQDFKPKWAWSCLSLHTFKVTCATARRANTPTYTVVWGELQWQRQPAQ